LWKKDANGNWQKITEIEKSLETPMWNLLTLPIMESFKIGDIISIGAGISGVNTKYPMPEVGANYYFWVKDFFTSYDEESYMRTYEEEWSGGSTVIEQKDLPDGKKIPDLRESL
jgi:hypothetical protein